MSVSLVVHKRHRVAYWILLFFSQLDKCSWMFSQSIVHWCPAIVLTAFGMPVQPVLVTANKLMYLMYCVSFACGLLFFRNLARDCQTGLCTIVRFWLAPLKRFEMLGHPGATPL
jgi:hypothetical protein